MGQSSSNSNVDSTAPRTTDAAINNLPPLTFHQVHGDHVHLSDSNRVARRTESFCKGVTFSARPVRVGEKVCIKFLEISDHWSGVIRFGFTSNDPVNLRNGIPRYACPDLTNKPGYWAKALSERFATHDAVLYYYLTGSGEVHFGVNGEEKGVFLTGVETRGPVWALIDVYGNSTAIKFLDPNGEQFNNARGGSGSASNSNNNSSNGSSNGISCNGPETHNGLNDDCSQHARSAAMEDASNVGRDLEHVIVPSMQVVSINDDEEIPLPGLRFQPPGVIFTPLAFHSTCGRNIRFLNQQSVATRTDTEFCHGYAFTNRPLILGERLVVQIIATERMYVGALALGLTSCDPARLAAEDLPDDSDLLLDRPEYWVVSKDVASGPQSGDEIAFTVSHLGEVQMSKNGGPPRVVMHVDQSLQLWAFIDVYGSTQSVRMLVSRPGSPPRARVAGPVQAPPTTQPQAQQQPGGSHGNAAVELVQLKPAAGGGTVLVVNLPTQRFRKPSPTVAGSPPSGDAAAAANSRVVESGEGGGVIAPAPAAHLQQWTEGLEPPPREPSECSICYERYVDSVLYMCGHMCMCYKCALQQWRGRGGGHCPLCRAEIKDVIRIYRS